MACGVRAVTLEDMSPRRVRTGIFALVVASLTTALGVAPVAQAATATTRYIVRFTDGTSTATVESLTKKNWSITSVIGSREYKKMSRVFNGAVATLTNSELTELRKSSNVLWAEADATVTKQATVSPTPSWGLDRIDQRALPLDSSYTYPNDGAGVDVYMVDTGIDTAQTQFTGRLGQAPTNGYDGIVDGNGTDDCNGHGTHAAGIAGGSTYGVAPAVRLIPIRVLDCTGSGTISGVIAGIDWAIGHHTTTPAVMNLSLGTSKSASLDSAVDRAFADGITMVVAAGNSNVDACNTSPAGDKVSALTVGASTTSDSRASFSNFGDCLDIFAPGVSITSAGISSATASAVMSGTSMAAPHVTGLVARYLSVNLTANPTTVMNAIIAESTPDVVTNAGTASPNRLAFASSGVVPSPSSSAPSSTSPGTTPSTAPSTNAPTTTVTVPPTTTTTIPPVVATPPSPTSNVSAVAGASSAVLSWTPEANGGLPITSHIIRVYRGGALVKTVVVDADTIHTIGGLQSGSTHTFSVAAMNGLGVSDFSSSSTSIIPLKITATYSKAKPSTVETVVPGAPTKVTATRSKSQVIFRWTPPKNASVSSFQIMISKSGSTVADITTTASGGLRLSGLKKGKYAFVVVAKNMAGTSRPSAIRSFTL